MEGEVTRQPVNAPVSGVGVDLMTYSAYARLRKGVVLTRVLLLAAVANAVVCVVTGICTTPSGMMLVLQGSLQFLLIGGSIATLWRSEQTANRILHGGK